MSGAQWHLLPRPPAFRPHPTRWAGLTSSPGQPKECEEVGGGGEEREPPGRDKGAESGQDTQRREEAAEREVGQGHGAGLAESEAGPWPGSAGAGVCCLLADGRGTEAAGRWHGRRDRDGDRDRRGETQGTERHGDAHRDRGSETGTESPRGRDAERRTHGWTRRHGDRRTKRVQEHIATPTR